MRIRIGLLALVSMLAFGLAGAPQAQAGPVYFDFEGGCQAGPSGGGTPGIPTGDCGAFGLNEGDLVSGTFTFDMDDVVGLATVDVFGVGGSFEFTFGNQSFDLTDYNDIGDLTVTFNSDATQLSCISGFLGCPDYASFNNGWAGLQVRFDSVEIKSNSIDGKGPTMPMFSSIPAPPVAHAPGLWTRRPAQQVPEPSAVLMFVVGGLVVGAKRARRK